MNKSKEFFFRENFLKHFQNSMNNFYFQNSSKMKLQKKKNENFLEFNYEVEILKNYNKKNIFKVLFLKFI